MKSTFLSDTRAGLELPKGDFGSSSKQTKTQCVVRTSTGGRIGYQKLTDKLSEGYIVVFATKLTDGIIEYILEKVI